MARPADRVLSALWGRIDEMESSASSHLTSGGCKNMEDYKASIGRLEAYRFAKEAIEDMDRLLARGQEVL